MIPYQTKLAYKAIVMTGGSAPAAEEVPLEVYCKVTGPGGYTHTLLNYEPYTMTTGEDFVLSIDRADDTYSTTRRSLQASDITITAGPSDLEPSDLEVSQDRDLYRIAIPGNKIYVYDEAPRYLLEIIIPYT